MRRKWIAYYCSLPKLTLEELLSKQVSLFELGVTDIVQFSDESYGVSGRIESNTRSEVNYKFKLLKIQLKDLFNTNKIVDMLVAKGDCV